MSTDQELLAEQGRLQEEAAAVRTDLALDQRFSDIGTVTLVGSAALGLMLWRDLDLTVICQHLDVARIAALGPPLAEHERVRQIVLRDDTGDWNNDPLYPDGVYLGLRYRSPDGDDWNIDVWFVDEPHRQPDLAHLRTLPERITTDARRAILRIKDVWAGHPNYGSSITSHDVYTAVLDGHVRTNEQFAAWLEQRDDRAALDGAC